MSKYSHKPIGIFSFTGVGNYGGNLQTYALMRQLENLGYASEQIFYLGHRDKKSPFYHFRRKYFTLTEPVFSYSQCLQLNDRYTTLITGSDVVWQERFSRPEIGMLAWASGEKTLISYAASFGESFLHGRTPEDIIRAMLERFDAISVRESSGVEICNSLGIAAQHVLDPSLLLESADYDKLIKDFDGDLTTPINYVFLYNVLPLPDELIQKISDRLAQDNQELVICNYRDKNIYTPEQWLNLIKNASYILTDSFHGVCFSIIFKKQFIYLNHNVNSTRFKSLFQQLGINKGSADVSEISPEFLRKETPIDYAQVEQNLIPLKSASLNFLTQSLAIPPSPKPVFIDFELQKAGIAPKREKNIEYNPSGTDVWLNSHPYDFSFKSPNRDLLKFSVDLRLENLFFTYETDDEDEIKERTLCRSLLLAHARRILDPETYEKICNDDNYRNKPHLLLSFLDSYAYEEHRKQFKKRIEQLEGKEVYVLFAPYSSEKIFSYAQPYLKFLHPQEYLYHGVTYDTIRQAVPENFPLVPFLPFIKTARNFPVLSFGNQPYYMVGLFKHLGLPNEIIPCAFA